MKERTNLFHCVEIFERVRVFQFETNTNWTNTNRRNTIENITELELLGERTIILESIFANWNVLGERLYEIFCLVMEEKISACQTLAELAELERIHSLNEEEQRLVFERRLQIFQRIHEWREENKKLGLEPTISDFWTPEQRQRFLDEWSGDSYIIEASRGEKRTYDEMMSEEPSTSHQGALQTGRGEVDEGDNERPFYIESARQVYTKKFKNECQELSYSVYQCACRRWNYKFARTAAWNISTDSGRNRRRRSAAKSNTFRASFQSIG